jgi:pimeloyl-ACP methyl ester carboxylesterase
VNHTKYLRTLCLGLLGTILTASSTLAQQGIHHTVDSDGHPMALWEKSPENPTGTVLLLHGRTWSGVPDFDLQVPGEDLSLMDGLVGQGWSTFALDQRGYGATPRDATGWISPDRAAKDLINVLDWLWEYTGSQERPVLFGWSLGSMVSQLTVQRRPDLVSMVVLFGYPVSPGLGVALGDDPDEPARAPNTEENAASDFVVPGSISQAAIGAYVQQALAADPVRTDWRGGHEWGELDPELVTVPTLLMQGEHDPIAQTENQAAFFTRLGTADRQWVTIAGGDHAAFLEAPRAYFIDVLVGFMARPRKRH